MDRKMADLKFIITNDRMGQLVITWLNPPGADVEFYPAQLKQLAETLLDLVDGIPAANEILNS